MIQYITDGYNGRGDRVVLWRTGEYTYELEIAGKNLKFYETEFGEAIGYFDAAIANYQDFEITA